MESPVATGESFDTFLGYALVRGPAHPVRPPVVPRVVQLLPDFHPAPGQGESALRHWLARQPHDRVGPAAPPLSVLVFAARLLGGEGP